MQNPRYALVAYVRNSVGEFVEKLRGQLHPQLPHLSAHVTILPPRCLQGTENTARELLAELCCSVDPFEITLGDVETFVPVTPTIFIRVAHAAYKMRELHDRLNVKTLLAAEDWPYMPHLTIVKMETEPQAKNAFKIAHQRWNDYTGTRRVRIAELTFVREERENQWVDLTPIPLGRSLVSRQSP